MSAEAPDRLLSLPVLPLKNAVLFPNLLMPLVVGRARSLAAVEAAADSEDKSLVTLAQRDAAIEEPGIEHLFPVGTVGVIKRMERGDDRIQLVIQGTERVE